MTAPAPPEVPPSSGTPEPSPEAYASGPWPTVRGGRAGWRKFFKMWGFALFVVLILYAFRRIVVPFIFAGLIAFLLAPSVRRLTALRIWGRRMPRGVAVLLCYSVVLSAIGLFLGLLVPKLATDVERLVSNLPQYRMRFEKEWAPRIGDWIERTFPAAKHAEEVPPPPDPNGIPPGTHVVITPLPNTKYAISIESPIRIVPSDNGSYTISPASAAPSPTRHVSDQLRGLPGQLAEKWENYIDDLVDLAQWLILGLFGVFKTLVIVLMVAAFLLIDLDRVHAFARSLVPRDYRPHYDVILRGVEAGLSGVLRGQLIVCVINGILTWIGLFIFGVKYSALLAVLAGVLSLIPIFGTILSSIPIVAIAMVSAPTGFDLAKGGIILAWILMVHFIEANFLSPRIMGGAAKMHPVVVVFALVAGEHSFGLVGALLAVPFASVVQTVFMYLRDRQRDGFARGTTVPPAASEP